MELKAIYVAMALLAVGLLVAGAIAVLVRFLALD